MGNSNVHASNFTTLLFPSIVPALTAFRGHDVGDTAQACTTTRRPLPWDGNETSAALRWTLHVY